MFGKRLRECRENKKLSQSSLAKEVNVHQSLIGKYERDEVRPSIDVALKLAEVLDTTVGYLIGELDDNEVLKDNSMLKRLIDIEKLSKSDKDCMLFLIDGLLRDAKARQAYA